MMHFWKEFKRQEKDEEKYDFTGFVFPGDISFEKKELEKVAYFLVAQFSEKASFGGTQFSEKASFGGSQFSGEADFVGAQFSEKASFVGSQFSGEAYFVEAQFSGEADFVGAQFSGKASFEEAQFSGEANFERAQFSGLVYFLGAKFSEKADFRKAQFSEDAYFEKAQFSGEASFIEAQFSGEANFSLAKFSGKAYFGSAQVSGGATFLGAQFSGDANFACAQFSGEANFVVSQFSEKASFVEAQFSGEANFRDTEFHSKSFFLDVYFEDFDQCNMIDTSFYNVYGFLEYLAENKKKFKHPRGIKYLHNKCKPILGEATVSRLPLLSREIKDDIYLMGFKDKHPLMHYIWWLFADCGRSIFRWALWSIGFALYFAFNFWLIDYSYPGSFSFNPAIQGRDFWSYIYYSVVTFTTLGFGDIIPTLGWVQRWVMVEVIAGYIMLGGLISILANKLARRS